MAILWRGRSSTAAPTIWPWCAPSSLIVFGGELGAHPALLQATRARLAEHDFARPRLAITQLGPEAELKGALRLALETAEAALP
jgi:hypothetical protein